MTMQPISDDMVTTSKICVIVAKCKWALTFIIWHKPTLRFLSWIGKDPFALGDNDKLDLQQQSRFHSHLTTTIFKILICYHI